MDIENSPGHGSMFGVVDSMRNMTSAMEELLRFLPNKFDSLVKSLCRSN